MLDRMELNVPVANEKAITPKRTRMMQIDLSAIVPPEMSPNPTVVIVVTVKYSAVR